MNEFVQSIGIGILIIAVPCLIGLVIRFIGDLK